MTGRRAPIDRIVDFAFAIPTSTLVAARRAVPLVARAGTIGTARFVGRIAEAVQHQRLEASDDLDDETAVPEARDDDADGDAAPESLTADELPIDGYDDLAARQVVARLESLDRADLARIEIYEREHRNRSTVLGKIAALTA